MKANFQLHIHPFPTPQFRVAGGWSLSQRSSAGRRVQPGQVASPSHRDKQPCTLTLTTKDSLETPINLTCMFLDGGRKPENPERTHAHTGRTCRLHTARTSWELNLEPSAVRRRCDHTTLQPPTARSLTFSHHPVSRLQSPSPDMG